MLLQYLKLLTLTSLLVCPLLQAQQLSANETREIVASFQKAQSAAQKLSYSGTFIYQQANQIRTSRVTHALDNLGEIEKLEILDDKPREYLRRNDEVTCYLADSKTIQVEKNVTQEVFPALITANPEALFEIYKIKKAELTRVAGSSCQIFNLEPKDALRYAYRLCLEKIVVYYCVLKL